MYNFINDINFDKENNDLIIRSIVKCNYNYIKEQVRKYSFESMSKFEYVVNFEMSTNSHILPTNTEYITNKVLMKLIKKLRKIGLKVLLQELMYNNNNRILYNLTITWKNEKKLKKKSKEQKFIERELKINKKRYDQR